jgi:hypothetical protein
LAPALYARGSRSPEVDLGNWGPGRVRAVGLANKINTTGVVILLARFLWHIGPALYAGGSRSHRSGPGELGAGGSPRSREWSRGTVERAAFPQRGGEKIGHETGPVNRGKTDSICPAPWWENRSRNGSGNHGKRAEFPGEKSVAGSGEPRKRTAFPAPWWENRSRDGSGGGQHSPAR